MSLQDPQERALSDARRYEALGFTDDDASAYWNNIHNGMSEAQAEEHLFADRSLSVSDKAFVLLFLSYCKPSPFENYG